MTSRDRKETFTGVVKVVSWTSAFFQYRGTTMTKTRTILSGVTAALFVAVSAAAQGSSGFSLGVGGGFARSNDTGQGYELTSTLELPSAVSAIRPRFDLLLADLSDGPKLVAFTGNLLVTPFSSPKVAPYVLAGVGAYIEETSRPPKFGGQLGLGLRLPGQLRSVAIESVLHAYLLADPWSPFVPSQAVVDGSTSRSRLLWKPIGVTIQF
jgi:hypothetical protein